MFLFLFICFCTVLFGQENLNSDNIITAEQNILELKSGVLLVRLDLKKQEIAYYEKYNNQKEADKIRAKGLKENTAIISAFKMYFDFCPLYFFDAGDSHAVLAGDFSKVSFYNAQAEIDTTIRLIEPQFFIAEFGYLERDRSPISQAVNGELDWEGKTEDDVAKEKKNALVIRDSKFVQLKEPFPYYVGYNYYGFVNQIYQLPVQRIQEMLDNYLLSVQEKREH